MKDSGGDAEKEEPVGGLEIEREGECTRWPQSDGTSEVAPTREDSTAVMLLVRAHSCEALKRKFLSNTCSLSPGLMDWESKSSNTALYYHLLFNRVYGIWDKQFGMSTLRSAEPPLP
ncbi:unnamed protein product [Pleuronectes platessa]|uniref:Uncharacterized protein n=1 Tax=Pleuronectes platessa TaxID=8262 RepID=A0A9N7UA49_PLEPL|nr:unnamed protein product [Pleuronectes platessa]